MEVTLADAARRLGVTPRQAQRLAREGRLQEVRRVGNTVLVDDSSLTALSRASRGAGRRWEAKTAWAAIELLETGATQRLRGTTLSRLTSKVRSLTVEEFVRLASQRATTYRCQQSRRSEAALREALLLSGVSRLTDPGVAEHFALAPLAGSLMEVYVLTAEWPSHRERFGLVADAEGDVLIHVTTIEPVLGLVATALDLAERGSARERSAAVRVLQRMLGR